VESARRRVTRRRLFLAGWLGLLALSSLLPLSAVFRGVVHLGPDPLHVHGTLAQPVISIGGDVILPHGSHAIVIAIYGNIQIIGRASDDLVAADGNVYLHRHAQVDGDVLTLVGGIYRAPGVTANGRLGGVLHRWNGTSAKAGHQLGSAVATSVRLGLAAGLALLLVGTCLTVIFPWQVVLISTTLRASPLKSVGAGIVSLVTFVFLVVPLGLSLAGLPFALLLSVAASLAWLFGMTAAAMVVGRALAHRTVPLLWATAAGLVVLALIMAVPVLGPLLVTATGLVGAGALAVALLSRARPVAPFS